MEIGIIGAGNIGGTLSRRLSRIGHRVRIANSRGPESLAKLASESGAVAATGHDAVDGAELLVISIPEKAIAELPGDLFRKASADLVVVDTGNYYPRTRDGFIAAIEEGMAESLWVSQCLGRPVVKAFNNIAADHLLNLGRSRGAAGRIALPVAGDGVRDKAVVMKIVDDLGFDPVDAGSLAESWRQQPASPVYGTDLDARGVRDALARATIARTASFSAR